MKYIDAEILKAEIEERIALLKGVGSKGDYAKGSIDADTGILEYIAQLQQEQPEGLHFTPLNRLIQKIPSEKWNDNTNNYAKKLRNCLIKEGYLKDANVLQGYISYMNGNNIPMATMDEQEQPEMDLEEEAHMRGFAQGAKEERESLSPIMLTYAADVFSGKTLLDDISYSYRQELADYFRDLAKTAKATNARKEESK